MDCHFLTYHGTLLCFGHDGTDFRHVALDGLDDAALVTGAAACAALRQGTLEGRPMAIRPDRPARTGLPRMLGIDPGMRAGTVSLAWRDAHLCAGGQGGAILVSEQVDAWEEFLPVASEDVAVLRALNGLGWEWDRNGRRFEAGQIRIGENFRLAAGDLAIPLDRVVSLGGARALRDGRVSLLAQGWRIETLRRYDPLVVWRHDGSQTADEEIVLGLNSMMSNGQAGCRLLVETTLARDALLAKVPGLADAAFELTRPAGRAGLLPWLTRPDATPVLQLANGVICGGPLEPLLRELIDAHDVALPPWTWDATDAPDADTIFWGEDPLEASTALACGTAIIGVPNGERAARLGELIAMIAANRLDAVAVTDAAERDLLRYVVARDGGGSTGLLARHVSRHAAGADRSGRSLIDFRSVPPPVRLDAMRDALARAG